jgi:hypothetical protein
MRILKERSRHRTATLEATASIVDTLIVVLLCCIVRLNTISAELCSICSDGQILTKSDGIIQSGTIRFLPKDVTCLEAELNALEWTVEQCNHVRTKTTASTICGCKNSPDSTTSCGICRKGEIVTNPNGIIKAGTISFIKQDIKCKQAELDSETKWTVDQCSIAKTTNAATICGCNLRPRPIQIAGIQRGDNRQPSGNRPSPVMRRRRRKNTNIFQKQKG